MTDVNVTPPVDETPSVDEKPEEKLSNLGKREYSMMDDIFEFEEDSHKPHTKPIGVVRTLCKEAAQNRLLHALKSNKRP
jgi:hypothetical protein